MADDDFPNIDDSDENSKVDTDEIVARAKKLYEKDKQHWNPIYQAAKDDLDFLSDEEGAQWPEQEFQDRFNSGRATLQVNYLNQFVHQVANNIRMNTPSINPLPADDQASIEDAKMLKGLIRKIEYKWRADTVYDAGATSAVKCSIGFARVDHDFVSGSSTEQELKICKIINPFLVFMDSDTIESDGSDQNHCTVLDTMKVWKFRKEYPDAEVCSFDDSDNESRSYSDDDDITIAEVFIRSTTKEKTSVTNKRGNEYKRTKSKSVIKRFCMTGKEVLEETTFPGEYVPIIPFYGEEAWNDGKRHLHSLIRFSKQAQYMFNLMQSVEAEILLKQPIAPVTTPAGAIENYADDWLDPSKSMALRFDTTDPEGNPISFRPERLAPPAIPAGMVQASREAVDNMKATMGIYNNSLGEQGQEISGKAINARKIQADVATYHFGDNAVRSITQIGRVLVSAAPEIYDTARLIDIIDEEENPKQVGINGAVSEGQEKTHTINQGKYDVRVTTGASFTTKRQESAAFYQELIKSQPQLLMIFGDLMFQNMDVDGAPAAAARIKKMIDPKLLDDKPGQQPQDPRIAQMQQVIQQGEQVLQQQQRQIAQLQQQLKEKMTAISAKAQNDSERNQISMMQNQIKQQQVKMDSLIKLMQLSIQDRANDITEQKNAGDIAVKSAGQQFEQIMSIIDTLNTAEQQENQELPTGDMSANEGDISQGINPDA